MSVIQQAPLWYTESLQPNQRLVALALADFADDAGRCYPALKTIGLKCGYSRRQVSRIVQQLQAMGYVDVKVVATARSSPVYQLHPTRLKKYAIRKRGQYDTPPPEGHLDRFGGDTDVTSQVIEDISRGDTGDRLGVTDGASRGDTGDRLGVTPVSPSPSVTHQGPSENPLEEDGQLFGVETEEEQLVVTEHEDGTATVELAPGRPRNVAWDALVRVFGYEPETGEESLWGEIAAKANQTDDPAGEVTMRAARLMAQWKPKSLTPPSLKKWWNRFGTPLGAATEEQALKMRDDLEKAVSRRRAADIDGVVDLSDLPPAESGETVEVESEVTLLSDDDQQASADRARAEFLDAAEEVGEDDEASG